MKDKKQILVATILLLTVTASLYSQTPPTIGLKGNDTVIVNTGANYLLLPEMDDNDPADQSISFTFNSSNTSLLSIDSIAYQPGECFAVMYVKEHGATGSVSIDVEIDDGDGTASGSFDVHIVNYNKPGVNYQVHDIVFWQVVDPHGKTPLWDTILESPVVITDHINWNDIPLTVSGDCGGEWCDGHDFSTTIIEGYVIPPEDGDYTFYQTHANANAMWLSTDASYDNVDKILFNPPEGYAPIGSSTGVENEWQSDPVSLIADKVYAFYAVQWNIHFENVTLQWEGPGIEKQLISPDNLFYVYDTIPPDVPLNLRLFKKGDDEIIVHWSPSSDNQVLAGYYIYVNGIKVNNSPVKDTIYIIPELEPETRYSIVLTATDDMGNESLLSNTVTLSTFPLDENPPNPPDNIAMTDSTGVAVKISWDEATDTETEVRGYNVFVDGNKYNANYIYETFVIIGGLFPETNYEIEVRSVDAGNNESLTGTKLNVRTTRFEVGENLGVKNGKISVLMKPDSWNHGIGINFPHPYKEQMPDEMMLGYLSEMQVGSLRLTWDWDLGDHCDSWVATDHFMGAGIPYSIGDFMNLCNNLDAYTTLVITMQEDEWFVHDPQSFAHIIEYFAGPESSEWGAIRAAEGYTESLLESSRGLIIEYGNEVWGGNAHCAPLGEDYAEYAKWCREMDTIVKSSSYFDPEKIFTCYSGRNPRPEYSYGLNKTLYDGDNGQVDWIALSGYMGGNFDYDPGVEPGKTELDFLKNGIETMLDKLEGLEDQNRDMLILAGENKPIWFYEGNFTTSSYFGRFGQGIIFSDYIASGMELGLALPTIYSLYHGQWKIIAPSLGDKKLPLFHMVSLFNHYCKGDVLKTTFTSSNTIKNASGKVLDADPVSCHAYHNNGNYSILLISRDFEDDYYVQLDLPDTLTFNSNAEKIVITSDHFSSYDTRIDTSVIPITDNMLVTVPRYGMVLIHFNGADQEFDQLPLGYWDDYVKVEDITITCEENTHLIAEPFGRLHLDAIIAPDSAFVNSVRWEVFGNDIGVKFVNGTLIAPSTDNAVDTIIIKASADGVSDTFMVYVDLRVGIENIPVNNLHIYPNPVENNLSLMINSTGNMVLNIANIHGKLILTKNIQPGKVNINTSGLVPGVYLIRIITDNGRIWNEKFIKK